MMASHHSFSTVGICGYGKMGASFYAHLRQMQHRDTVVYARDVGKVERLIRRHGGTRSTVTLTDRLEDLGDCDIVFEFLAEDITVKRQVLARLVGQRRNPRQILATGSSSFVPSRISETYDAGRIIGVHFIYPLQTMSTVEVVYGEKTPVGLVEQVCLYIKEIGKTPVPLDERTGCITTRVLAVLGNEAYRLHAQYRIPFAVLDEIIEESGYTPAPFDLNDSVGLDTVYQCLSGHFEGRPEFDSFALLRDFLKDKISCGQLGKKSGQGFHCYRGGADATGARDYPVSPAIRMEIIDRIRTLYINSSFAVVEYGHLNCGELDRIFNEINGTAMGPARALFGEGAADVVKRLEHYARDYGRLFVPSPLIKYIAAHDQGRDNIDGQIRDLHLGGKRPDWYPEGRDR